MLAKQPRSGINKNNARQMTTKSLKQNNKSFQPNCKLSIDGHLEFTWKVEGDEFTSFLNAEPGVGFESEDFPYFGGFWKLKCYPNGTKKYGQGNVSLFLAVMKLPPRVIQLGVQYEFECREVNYKGMHIRAHPLNVYMCTIQMTQC